MKTKAMKSQRWVRGKRKLPYGLTLTPDHADLVRDWLKDNGLSLSYFVDQYLEQVAIMIKSEGLMDQVSRVQTCGDMLQVTGKLLNQLSEDGYKDALESGKDDSTGEPDGKGKSCLAGGSGEA